MAKGIIMRPQEKAEDLFWGFDANHDKTEFCVDEIIKALEELTLIDNTIIDYWNEVKQEIRTL